MQSQISKIFELEPTTIIDLTENLRGMSYLQSYPHLLSYLASCNSITETDYICAAHMVYGWMPTVLTLHFENPATNLKTVVALLNKAKNGDSLLPKKEEEMLSQLAKMTNNSVVGASKLLHFTNPDKYAIWDSKIYKFIFRKDANHSQVTQGNRMNA